MVSDAKTDDVEIIFRKIDLDHAAVVAIGDSSFANVGKNKTASQAGLVVLIADNKDDKFLKGNARRSVRWSGGRTGSTGSSRAR